MIVIKGNTNGIALKGKQSKIELAYGARGKSAYQVALDNGFEGSESEWLDTLEGAPGINIETSYAVGFYVDEDGHLICNYVGIEPPKYYIGEDGHLYLDLDESEVNDNA